MTDVTGQEAISRKKVLLSISFKRGLQCGLLLLTGAACFFSLKPLLGAIWLSSGNFYLEKKMLYLAMDNYRTGLGFDPQNSELHQRIGLLFLDLSEKGKNKTYVASGLAELQLAETLTGDPVADYRLGLGYEFAGDEKKSSYYFRRALVRSAGMVGR